VVYGYNLKSTLDLVSLPTSQRYSADANERAKAIKDLHEQVRKQIEKQNQKYERQANKHRRAVNFKGDLVWVHLSKERFPPGRHANLKQCGDGPFRILQRIGDNAYKVELSGDYGVSATFNVKDLSPYHGEHEPNSWASSFQPGNNDGNQDMRGLQVNNHDQENMFWTRSPLEELGSSQICNKFSK
jgi:hypothetical protein